MSCQGVSIKFCVSRLFFPYILLDPSNDLHPNIHRLLFNPKQCQGRDDEQQAKDAHEQGEAHVVPNRTPDIGPDGAGTRPSQVLDAQVAASFLLRDQGGAQSPAGGIEKARGDADQDGTNIQQARTDREDHHQGAKCGDHAAEKAQQFATKLIRQPTCWDAGNKNGDANKEDDASEHLLDVHTWLVRKALLQEVNGKNG